MSMVNVLNEIIKQHIIPVEELDNLKVAYHKQNTTVIELRSYYLGTWISRTDKGLVRRWQLYNKSEYTVNMILKEIDQSKGKTAQHYTKFSINLKKFNRQLGKRHHERNRRILENSI